MQRPSTFYRKHFNEELEQATQLVVEAEKQKTAFMQNMTHQVRTPLNVIMGYAQILNTSTTAILPSDSVSEDELLSPKRQSIRIVKRYRPIRL